MAGKGGGNDVLLVFGVQEGQSRLNIKDGLESIINGLEPFKIKVQLDESSKKSIKSELSDLMKGFTSGAKSSSINIKPNIQFDQKGLNSASGKLLDSISKGLLPSKAAPLLLDSKVASQAGKRYAATMIQAAQDSFKADGTTKFLTDKMNRELAALNKAYKANSGNKQLEAQIKELYQAREGIKQIGTISESDLAGWDTLVGKAQETVKRAEAAKQLQEQMNNNFNRNVEGAKVFDGYKAQLEHFQQIFRELSSGSSINENGMAKTMRQLESRLQEFGKFSKDDFIGDRAKQQISEMQQLGKAIDLLIVKAREKDSVFRSKNNSEMASVKQVTAAYQQLNSVLANNKKAIGTDGYKELSDIAARLKEASISSKGSNSNILKTDFDDMVARASQLQAEFTAAGVAGQTLGEKIKAMYAKFGGWSLITMSMMKLRQVLRDSVQDVIAIDTAMTELKRVTNESDATYEKFLSGAADRARTVGTSIKETVNATADFARLGYSIGDASELADVAVMYKNVGDGIDDVGTATQSIISTMKAFNMETSDSMHVVDAFDKTGEKHCPAA